MTVTPIGVTGATGRLGGRIARRLAQAGVHQRLLVRDPARAPRLAGTTTALASYDDGDALRRGLTGLDTVLMVSASEDPDRIRLHRTFIDAAVAAGVRHLVYTSFYGASPDATFTHVHDHAATEQCLRDSGLQWTFLRDNMYADFLPELVGEDGYIRGPAGDGRVAAVTQDDIAEAATIVLQNAADHVGQTYDLTGPDSLTLSDVAAIITEVTGRRVAYYNESVPEAYASRSTFGAPDWLLDAWVSTYTAIAAGELAGIGTGVADLTGHPATSFGQYLRNQQQAAARD
jgi:NAD(P)H dehydrogenase (quinone)